MKTSSQRVMTMDKEYSGFLKRSFPALVFLIIICGILVASGGFKLSFFSSLGNQTNTNAVLTPKPPATNPAAVPRLPETNPALKPKTPSWYPNFVDMAEKLEPSVVNIFTTQLVNRKGRPMPKGFEDFFGDDFRGGPRKKFKQQSLGSGFIISSDGKIVTNGHVVQNATEIRVRLADDREYEAIIMGVDINTDLALISVNAKGLKAVEFGDSDKLKIGEWVMAIGNPFGLSNTVTAGIVSAKGRYIGLGPFDDLIQTDASINPGNSGGPLVNTDGKVVGINTAIFSQHGGSVGIGFAVPINLARDVIRQLDETGRVSRGWLGVEIQKVTPELATSFNMKKAYGALVSNVVPGGPAQIGGLRAGDVIVSLDGKKVNNVKALLKLVTGADVGKQVKLEVIRSGRKLSFMVELGERPDDSPKLAMPGGTRTPKIGVTVSEISEDIARQLGIEPHSGIIILDVERGSLAGEYDLRKGDIIKAINDQKVHNIAEYMKAMRSVKKGTIVRFFILRGNGTIFKAFRLK